MAFAMKAQPIKGTKHIKNTSVKWWWSNQLYLLMVTEVWDREPDSSCNESHRPGKVSGCFPNSSASTGFLKSTSTNMKEEHVMIYVTHKTLCLLQAKVHKPEFSAPVCVVMKGHLLKHSAPLHPQTFSAPNRWPTSTNQLSYPALTTSLKSLKSFQRGHFIVS